MRVVIHADWFKDAGTAGTGGLQADLGFFNDVQDVGQVFAINRVHELSISLSAWKYCKYINDFRLCVSFV
jgi:hypothetical protein